LYVQGRRQRFGADAAWTPRGWTFAAEVIQATDQRLEQGLDFQDLPSVLARGWSVAAKHRFWRRPGGSSAREIDAGVRFDWLSFDDTAAPTGRDSVRLRATDVRARSAGTLTAGVTWRPTAWSRVLANASWERYGESRSAPEAGKASPYFTFGTRFQLELP
jgi:hypothetical protein